MLGFLFLIVEQVPMARKIEVLKNLLQMLDMRDDDDDDDGSEGLSVYFL